jgi:DHA1 family tetracycline resistance protein-like MFS transporter
MSPLIIVFVTVFIDLLGFGIIIPLMPFYATHFGASAFQVGMLATSFSLMQFLFAPLWGRWSDVVGRRPIILIGLLGSAVSYLAFGLAHSLTLLFVSRCLAGIAGANIPTAQAYIADSTTPENRAKGMGMVGAAFGLGFIFGPALGGFLSQWGYQAPALFAAGLSLLNFLAALVLLPESLPPERRSAARRRSRVEVFRHALARPRLPTVLAVFFLIVSAFASFESMFALYSQARFGFDTVTIGFLFAGVGVILAIVQGLLVGRVVKRLGEHRLVPAAIALLTIGLALVSVAQSVPALAVGCAIIAVGMGFQSPSMLSVISQLSDPADQGSMLGVSQSLGSLARIVGPLWGGFVFDRFGHAAPFLSAAVVMSIACALSLAAFRGYRPAHRAGVATEPTGGVMNVSG